MFHRFLHSSSVQCDNVKKIIQIEKKIQKESCKKIK